MRQESDCGRENLWTASPILPVWAGMGAGAIYWLASGAGGAAQRSSSSCWRGTHLRRPTEQGAGLMHARMRGAAWIYDLSVCRLWVVKRNSRDNYAGRFRELC